MTRPRHDYASRPVDQEPIPGPYRLRLCARGWGVPCQIVRLADGAGRRWYAICDERVGFSHQEWALAEHVYEIHYFGERITEAHYAALIELKTAMRAKHPAHPCLHPHRPMRWGDAVLVPMGGK